MNDPRLILSASLYLQASFAVFSGQIESQLTFVANRSVGVTYLYTKEDEQDFEGSTSSIVM